MVYVCSDIYILFDVFVILLVVGYIYYMMYYVFDLVVNNII